MAKISLVFVTIVIVLVVLISTQEGSAQQRRRRRNQNSSVVDFIRRSMRKYGEDKVQSAFESLDGKNITEIVKILIGQPEKQIADDIVSLQKHAVKEEPNLVSLIRRVYAGVPVPPKEIFEMDEKLKIYPWWRRLRGRVTSNTDKYISSYANSPAPTRRADTGEQSKSNATIVLSVPVVTPSSISTATTTTTVKS